MSIEIEVRRAKHSDGRGCERCWERPWNKILRWYEDDGVLTIQACGSCAKKIQAALKAVGIPAQ